MRSPKAAKLTYGIQKYRLLAFVYLISVASSTIANSTNGDVQNLYRVPLLNVRWIDISILLILFNFFYVLFSARERIKNSGPLASLCFIYLIFESFQLIRSWGFYDSTSQISHFICTLSLFIVIDLSTFAIPVNRVILFLKKFIIWGAFVVILSNLYLLYSFISGNVVFEDLDIRVALEVVGSKETVYPFVLTPLVYAFGLFFIQRSGPFWEKALFLFAIFSIYGGMVITFHRGTLITILLITVYFLFSSVKAVQSLAKMASMFLFLTIAYLIFGGALAQKGYDPIKKIIQTAEFTTDVDNPEWDKGRSVSQEYAIEAWKKNFWIGAGYDELLHYGLPEGIATAHNGFITSLFHRGVVGTVLLIVILFLLFKYAVLLWMGLKKSHSYQDEMMKLLVVVSFFWIIIFMTQEALWEKYSLSIEFMYLGLIFNCYKQRIPGSTGYKNYVKAQNHPHDAA